MFYNYIRINSLRGQCGNGKTTQTGTKKMFYTLQNRHAKIKVNDFGAELSSVVIDGKERLWQNSDGTWNEHAPLLFPVCGHFGCTVDGKLTRCRRTDLRKNFRS